MKRLGNLLSACLLAAIIAVAPAPTFAASSSLPDRVRFGARMELGDIDSARQWLDAGLDPNFLGDRIGTGLMIGAWTGNIPLMELFAARGADINHTNSLGETALLHAAWRGHAAAVNWLLARGAQVNRPGNEWSALHYAAFAGHGETAKLLLDRGADINARTPNGSSVLMMAIYEGHADVAQQLIERGADRSIRNERGDGALEWAVKFKHGNIARLLGSAEELARAAANAPKVVAPRSLDEPPDIEEVLRIRRILQSRGIGLDTIDQRIASMRAQVSRPQPRGARLPVVLEISARRRDPDDQRVELRRQ